MAQINIVIFTLLYEEINFDNFVNILRNFANTFTFLKIAGDLLDDTNLLKMTGNYFLFS